jgi:hypothetical protein
MTGWLSRFIRLQPGEGGRVALFALLGALVQCGLAIGMSTADSLFLAHIGIARLPVIYLLTPVVMLIYIPVHSLLISRLGIGRVFQVTMGTLTAGGVIFAAIFMVLGPDAVPDAVYYGAKFYAAAWWIALYSLYWNFADSYFDILDAKRLYSLLSAASAVGAGVGGVIVTELSHLLEVPQLFLAWAALALAAVPVLFLIARRCRLLEDPDDSEDARQLGLMDQGSVIAGTVQRSRYSLLLIAVLFTGLVITAICEFRYMGIFSEHRSEHQLAELFGRLYAWVSVFNLVVTLFVLNRLVAWIGVRNTALIQPLAYIGVFLCFLLDDGMAPALLGFFAYQGILVTIDYNNVNFLLNALPTETKKQVRTFIEGICEPLSTAAAGLFLLLSANRLGPDRLAIVGLLLAGVFLVLVLFLRVEYVRAMIINLKRGWLDFSRSLKQLVRGFSQAELAWLAHTAGSARPEDTLLSIRILWLADKYRAVDCLLAFITPPEEGRCRAAQPLLSQMLSDGDHELIRRVLAWLDRCHETLPPALLEEFGQRGLIATEDLKGYLHAAAPDKRAAAAAALAHSWKIADGSISLQTLNRLLKGSAADRRAAITGIGYMGQSRYAHFLVPILQGGAAAERLEALLAIRRLAGRDSSRLLPSILQVVVNGSPEERALALDILEKLSDPDSISPLLDASDDFSPQALRRTESVVLGIGLRGVPAIASYLLDPARPYPGRSLAARALASASFTQFETIYPGLIEGEITRAYAFLGRHAQLAGAATIGRSVLSRFYGDMPETVIDFILELLGLGGRLQDFESIAASLRSRNSKDRANAIETVEQACPRQTFARLAPLLDSRPLGDKLAAGRRLDSAPVPAADAIVESACASRFLIEAAAGLQAVWESNPGRIRGAINERIRNSPQQGLRGVVLSLLVRQAGGTGSDGPTLVEKVHALAGTALFAGLRIHELTLLGERARFVSPVGSEAQADGCWIVLSGEVDVRAAKATRTVGPGETWGESSLWQRSGEHSVVAGRNLRALFLAFNEVQELARRAPRVAIALLRQKWEVGRAA